MLFIGMGLPQDMGIAITEYACMWLIVLISGFEGQSFKITNTLYTYLFNCTHSLSLVLM